MVAEEEVAGPEFLVNVRHFTSMCITNVLLVAIQRQRSWSHVEDPMRGQVKDGSQDISLSNHVYNILMICQDIRGWFRAALRPFDSQKVLSIDGMF